MNTVTKLIACTAGLALAASVQVVSTASASSSTPKPLAGPERCC
jgi:hypothetical protein